MRSLSLLFGCLAFGACQDVVELYPDGSALSRDATEPDATEPDATAADAIAPDATEDAATDALPADLGSPDLGLPDAGAPEDTGIIELPDSGVPPGCVCRWIRCRSDPECAVVSRTSVCGRDFVCTEAIGTCRLASDCGAQAQWSCTVDARSTNACP